MQRIGEIAQSIGLNAMLGNVICCLSNLLTNNLVVKRRFLAKILTVKFA